MSKRREILHGLKPILLGLLLMAFVYAALAAARTFGAENKMEFVALGGLILAWLPVLYGSLLLRKERPEFEYAFFTSIISLVALFAETGLGVKNFLNNMAEQTFIQFDVMFFGYIALLGMVILYRFIMKGISGLSGDKTEKKANSEWKTVWWVGLLIIFSGTLFIPVATLFPGAAAKIMAVAVILLVLGTELFWCRYIYKGYHALQKKR